MSARYDPQVRLAGWGEEGQRRLTSARVLVVGAGGLGFPVLTYLAGAGVGTLLVADGDVVTVSNLHRQLLFTADDVGQSKSDCAAAYLRRLNPDVQVSSLPFVGSDELAELVPSVDVVLDCTDNFDAKFALSDACADAGIPLIWGTIVGWQFQVSVFWSGAAPDKALTLRDVVPEKPASSVSSREVGVLGPVVGQAGSAMATEACKILTGLGEPLCGQILIVDALCGRYDMIPLRRRSA